MKIETILQPFVFSSAHRGLVLVLGRRASGRTTLIKKFLSETAGEWPYVLLVGAAGEYDGIIPREQVYDYGTPVERMDAVLDATRDKPDHQLLLVMENVSWNTLGAIRPLLQKHPNKLCVIACVEVCGGDEEEEDLLELESCVELLEKSTVVFGAGLGPACTKILAERARVPIGMVSCTGRVTASFSCVAPPRE
jgi:hypothetical protein